MLSVTTLLGRVALAQRLEAELLLANVLGVNRAYLHTHPEHVVTAAQQSDFESVMHRWMLGEPLAYLTGRQSFWTIDLEVTRATLIPRVETELLVELALQRGFDQMRVADLGTGSGAIALALAFEKPAWEIYATDVSHEALRVAEKNAEKLSIKNVLFRQGDWCDALPKCLFDMIVSNPPYVAQDDVYLARSVYDYEPHRALFSEEDGLKDSRRIMDDALHYLKAGGYLLLEHGFQQGEKVRSLLAESGYIDIKTTLDFSGLERVTMGMKQ